ncbi:patatin-like phospholipase family protein [Arsukibacterium indicum]|uniref:Patatin family protein n=1 Tax=Arsukibacterium indicum TaxID=2848612 RepID=A0ABS6MQW3_9GAMM|nr:patatin family protein [Arsukibacterium indicum]MBV2130789.1 patatin family protein [Arsukibacterium indicum]
MNKLSHANKAALVVEGGAMRGIFAAGVLDAFIEQQYQPFQFAIGVSAGSTNLIGYLAGDHGRSRQILLDHARRTDFLNWRRYLKGGHFCDVSWLWHASFDEVPLNVEHYLQQQVPLYAVTTSVITGQARYFEVTADNMHQLFPASCAIPLMYRDFPRIDGEQMTDGGLADAIPVLKAYAMGARDITVVLSQPSGYRKRASPMPVLMKPFFKQYPQMFSAVLTRTARYNQALEFIASPPADCRVRVVAPPANFSVGRFCQNPQQLEAGYQAGRLSGLQHVAGSWDPGADACLESPAKTL